MALYYGITSMSSDPSGIKEISNSTKTLKAMNFPRRCLAEFYNMPESKQAGIYLLYGTTQCKSNHIYIGQSGFDIGARISDHNRDCFSWDYALVFIEKSNFLNMNSDHVKLISSILISEAEKNGILVMNSNKNELPGIQRGDRIVAEDWAREAILISQLLGLPYFSKLQNWKQHSENERQQTECEYLSNHLVTELELKKTQLRKVPNSSAIEKPIKFKIKNKSHKIYIFNTWAGMLIDYCNAIIEDCGSSMFTSMVLAEPQFRRLHKRRPSFSLQESVYIHAHERLKNGCYVNTNLGSNAILKVCKILGNLFPDDILQLIYENSIYDVN